MNPIGAQFAAMLPLLAGQASPQADPLMLMLQQLQTMAAQQADGPDPNNAFEEEIDANSLGSAVYDSWQRLAPYRDVRTSTLAKFAGRHYPDTGIDQEQYVNLMQQAVETIISQVVSNDPKAHVEPIAGGLQIPALIRELSLNRAAKKAKLGDLHFDMVMEALFAPFCIVKTGLKAGQEQVSVGSKTFNRGEFYAEMVDFGDYVCDQSARKDREFVWEGHRMRVARSVALAAEKEAGVPLYDEAAIRNVKRLQLSKSEPNDSEELSGHSGDPYDLIDMIELWEIYVYYGDRTMVYTLSDIGGGAKFVREPYQHWGPEDGPYIKLFFTPLPSNALPVAYSTRILDLHDAAAETAKRFIDGFKSTKVSHIYRPGEEDLADALKNADDNEYIKGDPTAVNSVKSGGVVPELQPGMEFIMSLFNNASGSSQLLSGQKDIAKTATAATILQGNAQARIGIMQAKGLGALGRIFEHMAWYQDSDPGLRETLVARLPGGVKVELENTPELREGDFTDFVYSTDAYASKPVDPMVKMQKLVEALGVLFQAMQLGPQGFSKVAQILAKELQIPEIDEINPDPTMMMAKQAVVQQEGGPPKDNPAKKPQPSQSSRPAPYQGTLGNARSAATRGQPAFAGAR